MKRITLGAMATAALASSALLGLAPSAQAANRCDSVKSSGATASVRCAGPAQFTSFQFVINCYDGVSDTQYPIASAWLPRGSTARLTCGAPQRQYVISTYANFR